MSDKTKEELAYESVSDPSWAAEVDKWPWVQRDTSERSKSGKCPRCKHSMGFTEEILVGAAMATIGTEVPRRYAACNCPVEHPGAPKGEGGCGAGGLVKRPG